jgi:hypothetical protein
MTGLSQVELSLDQVLTIDAQLPIGGVRQEIQVHGESVAPVDLNDAQVGNLVDSRRMQDSPLILRDPCQLILLSPGVTQTNTLFGGFSVNGSRERSNNHQLAPYSIGNEDQLLTGCGRTCVASLGKTSTCGMAKFYKFLLTNR